MADVLSKGFSAACCGGGGGHGVFACRSPARRIADASSVGFPCRLSLSSSSAASLGSVRALSSRSSFYGKKVVVADRRRKAVKGALRALPVKMTLTIGKTMKWWEKGVQPNMRGILSAQDLVDSLLNAGDKLVVVDFFSPGCGGCRALHPKICQIAETNPDALFLQVNYEEHKSMCYSLNVHVLPFFRFYRGAHGRLCSFSCTNATIKKFKDALAKHSTDRCSLGPTRGLEESELLALSANKDLSFTYTKSPEQSSTPSESAEPIPASLSAPPKPMTTGDKAYVAAWR